MATFERGSGGKGGRKWFVIGENKAKAFSVGKKGKKSASGAKGGQDQTAGKKKVRLDRAAGGAVGVKRGREREHAG